MLFRVVYTFALLSSVSSSPSLLEKKNPPRQKAKWVHDGGRMAYDLVLNPSCFEPNFFVVVFLGRNISFGRWERNPSASFHPHHHLSSVARTIGDMGNPETTHQNRLTEPEDPFKTGIERLELQELNVRQNKQKLERKHFSLPFQCSRKGLSFPLVLYNTTFIHICQYYIKPHQGDTLMVIKTLFCDDRHKIV